MEKKCHIAGIDFETSGHSRSHGKAKPIEIGLATIDTQSNELKILADSRLSGASWITSHAWRTHQITLADCRNQPQIQSFWPHIGQTARRMPLCAHSIATERNILCEYFPLEDFEWIDTLQLSRWWLPHLPNHKLQTVCNFLQVTPTLQKLFPEDWWHKSLFDAVASLLIVQQCIKRNPHLQIKDLIYRKKSKKTAKR